MEKTRKIPRGWRGRQGIPRVGSRSDRRPGGKRRQHREPPVRFPSSWIAPVGAIFLAAIAGIFVGRIGIGGRPANATAPVAENLAQAYVGLDSQPIDEPVGSGALARSRDTDFVHRVERGETLSEIAYLYRIDFSRLALYNNLANPNNLSPGQQLLIPSIRNEQSIRGGSPPQKEHLSVVSPGEPGQRIRIVVDKQTDGRTVTANFFLERGQDAAYAQYEWDLGNGRKSFRASTAWTYETPGTYTVSLTAWDEEGRQYRSNRIYLDVPYPGTWRTGERRYITLDTVGESFEVDGEIVEVRGYPSVPESPIAATGPEKGLFCYSANAAGFFNLTVDLAGERSHVFLFVSPVPSRQVDRADVDWYRTQFNTGTLSNCGPSMVSMAIAWAKGDYTPVAKVREAVGWRGDGGTSFEELTRVLREQGVTAGLQTVAGVEDITAIIDSGRIAVLLYDTGSVDRASGDPRENLFGTYYDDDFGHYVMVKGYSQDRKWLVVYDPVPSDWSSNSVRYADGMSMLGKNRYYPVEQLFSSMRRSSVLVIDR